MNREEETDVLQRFHRWYDAALEGPNYLTADADEIAEIYEGQRRITRASEKCCDIEVNLFFRIAQSIIGKLTDMQQTAEYTPRGDAAKRLLSIVRTEQFRAHWDMYDASSVWEEAVEDAAKLGIGWVKAGYDPSAFRAPDTGKEFPDMVPERVDPHMILIDPACARLDLSDANYVFHLRWMPVTDLAELAGVDADDISRDDWEAPDLDESRWERDKDEYGNVLVAEVWWKCRETDDDGNLKYPYGRRTLCTAGRVWLDEPVPFATDMVAFPFFPIIFIRQSGTVSGIPMGRYLLKAQKWYNVLLATVVDNARLTTYVKYFVNRYADISISSLHNGPGQFVPYMPVGEKPVHVVQPGVVPDYVFRLLDRILSLIEWVSGYVEVSQGRQPGSVRSGRGIDFLRQEADTGVRLYSRRLAYAIRLYARLFLWVAEEMYEEARVVRVSGTLYERAKQAYDRYMDWLREQMLVAIAEGDMPRTDMHDVVHGKKRWGDKQHVRRIGRDETSAYFEVFGSRMAYAYDVKIVPDTASPWSRQARNQTGLLLVQNGLPLSLFVEYFADLPMRNEELLARLREMENRRAQLEMAALAAKGRAPGPAAVPEAEPGAVPRLEENFEKMLAGLASR